jgi:hypothetical protein
MLTFPSFSMHYIPPCLNYNVSSHHPYSCLNKHINQNPKHKPNVNISFFFYALQSIWSCFKATPTGLCELIGKMNILKTERPVLLNKISWL